MRFKYSSRRWQMFVLVILLTGTLFAASSETILYPGLGTTVNGNAVYHSVILASADRIQTGTAVGKITTGDLELEMAPNTILFVGEPFLLDCGSVVIRSGVGKVSDGTTTTTFAVGESARAISAFCGALVPDAPSAIRSERQHALFSKFTRRSGAPPAATSGILYVDSRVATGSFWGLNGAMFGSSIISARLTQDCLHAGACSSVPRAFRSSAAMYGAGLPAAAAVSYLTYYFKSKGYRWWFVPAALVTAGNIVVSTHAAHYSH
jgi:hypothetical protein